MMTNSNNDEKQIEKPSIVSFLVTLLFLFCWISPLVCSIIFLVAWSKKDVNTSFNSALVLAISSFLYICFYTHSYLNQKENKNSSSLIFQYLVFIPVSGISCILVKELHDLKNKSQDEITNKMQNNTELKNLHYIAGLLIPVSICFELIVVAYQNTVEKKVSTNNKSE
jgi:hypothetical protein